MSTEKQRLLDAWRDILGTENFTCPFELPRNLGHFRERRVLALLRPRTRQQVHAIVSSCVSAAAPIPIYPISAGANWGLGSRLPPRDDCVLMDLGAMDRILHLDYVNGIAVIEPGVTQGALSRQLATSELVANMTTSASTSSIVGNALERGIGLLGQRVDEVIGIEVVTGRAEFLRVGGFWPHTADPDRAFYYPHGIGPDLRHLFQQSNFGIVTAMAISLSHRPERCHVVRLAIEQGTVERALVLLRRLYQEGALRHVTRIYDTAAILSYASTRADVRRGYVRISGPSEIARAGLERLLDQARACGIVGVDVLDDARALDPLERALVASHGGDPSFNDEMIRVGFGTEAQQLDAKCGDGWISLLPIVPFDTELVRAVEREVRMAFADVRARVHITLNLLSARAIDMVVGVRFSADEATSVHNAAADVWRRLNALGVRSYRNDISAPTVNENCEGAYQKALEGISCVFDPRGIIAPGRYIGTVEGS